MQGKGSGIPRRVGTIVRQGLERSRWIAWVGRPRDLRDPSGKAGEDRGRVDGKVSAESDRQRPLSDVGEKQPNDAKEAAGPPVWGTISHSGWSSPDSSDLPNLHLPPIILELPHLIEAKAVALASPSLFPAHHQHESTSLGLAYTDPQQDQFSPAPQTSPSPLATSILQRPAPMGLRDYLTHLSSLDLINPPSLATIFLEMYESARFSGREISEDKFRALMGVFAEILRGMKGLSPGLIEEISGAEKVEMDIVEAEAQNGEEGEGEWLDGARDADTEDGQPRASMETTSTVAHTPLPPPSSHSPTSLDFRTSQNVPDDRSNSSTTSSAKSRHGLRTPSIPSIRVQQSLRSRASSVFTSRSSERSVIHLAEEEGPLDLPYVIDGGGARGGE